MGFRIDLTGYFFVGEPVKIPARHGERLREAGGVVRLAEHLYLRTIRCEVPPHGGARQKNLSFCKFRANCIAALTFSNLSVESVVISDPIFPFDTV